MKGILYMSHTVLLLRTGLKKKKMVYSMFIENFYPTDWLIGENVLIKKKYLNN